MDALLVSFNYGSIITKFTRLGSKLRQQYHDLPVVTQERQKLAKKFEIQSLHCCRLQAVYSPITVKNFVTVYTAFICF